MKKKMLIMILWGFPLCFCGGAEFPEFTVDDYGSVLVGSPERPVPVDPKYNPKTNGIIYFFWLFTDDGYSWYNSEGGQDYLRMDGDDLSWVEDVDPYYWEEFKEKYPQYWDEVENYFEQNPTAPNNPFYKPEPEDPIVIPEDPSMPLSDDIGAIMGMILMGIAYGVFAYRMRRQ